MSPEQEAEARAELAARMARYRENDAAETIDGLVYTSSKLPTMRGLAMLGRLAVALGEQGLRLIATNVVSLRSSFSAAIAKPQLFTAVVQIMQGLNDDANLIPDLLAQVKCNKIRPAGKPGELTRSAIDQHFMGEYPHLLEVVQFVVSHNLAGFTLGSLSTSGSRSSSETTTETPSV